MCTWSYSHHHHQPPCPRPIDMVVNYNYCAGATTDPHTLMTLPCEATYYGDDMALMNQVDYNDPCATGGCLQSPECQTGACRIAQLGGRWVCCQCGGRGNETSHCNNRPRTCPDTFCYHPICYGCRADTGGAQSSFSSPSSGSSSSSSGAGSGSKRRRHR